MTKIKICGITNEEDALLASRLGADMLGFVFYPKSKRYVTPEKVSDITKKLPPYVAKVGVFVNEKRDSALEIARLAKIDILQFHGDETPEYCGPFIGDFKIIKAFRLEAKEDLDRINDYNVDFYLLDTYAPDTAGGTGKTFDWSIIKDFEFSKPVILSGGLTSDNVEDAIRKTAPYGVDVSSGLEMSPGKKDAGKMKRFMKNVRRSN
jgi:phosphoribosylanthranilate isomerase